MTVKETKLKGCFILEPKVFEDSRGYFFESFNQKTFNKLIGQNINFILDNGCLYICLNTFSISNTYTSLTFTLESK